MTNRTKGYSREFKIEAVKLSYNRDQKRGKSTLLNALLSEPFLPTGVVPVTAIPTLLEYGPTRQARIIFHDGTAWFVSPDELAAYVTETANPTTS